MTESFNEHAPWVLFNLNRQILAVSADSTQEMITIPDVTPIPRTPQFVRGVINLRGSVIALLDLRLKLNQPSMREEVEGLISELGKRKQEHIDWLNTLQRSVEKNEPFTLARDPHQCNFGKWYDNYHPQNARLAGVLAEIDIPHRAIHAMADTVDGLLAKNKKQQALDLIEKARETHMAKILDIFEELTNTLCIVSQEVAIVVEHDNTVIALTVDSVEGVESLAEGSLENLPGDTGSEGNYIITKLARRRSNNEPVLIPDLGRIIGAEDIASFVMAE